MNRTYRDANGEQKEEVSYIDCSAWAKPGEIIAQYAKKGSGILVSGRLSQRSWEDKTDGKRRSRTEIVVEDFTFVGGGANGSSAGGSSYSSAPSGDGSGSAVATPASASTSISSSSS